MRSLGIVGWILLMLAVTVDQCSAQERTFTVTLGEKNWNAIAKIVSKAKDVSWEETNPILSEIGAQIRRQLDQANNQAKENAHLRAEVQRLQGELKKIVDAAKPENPR